MGEVINDIKIEVQLPPAEGDNLLTNTSGQYGAWQWSNDNLTSDVSIVGDPVARTITATRGATAGSTGIWTDHVPVTPGRYANARIDLLSVTTGHKVTLGLQFYNATDGVVSWHYSSPSTMLDTLAFSSVLVPAGAVSVRLLVILDKTADPNPDTGSANAGASFSFTRAMVAELTTAGVPSIVATNLMPNGGFQHVATGWTTGQNIASISRFEYVGGAWVLRADTSETTLSNGEGCYVHGPYVSGLEGGENYSLRVDVRADVMTDGHTLEPTMYYCWYDDSNTQIGSCTFVDSGVTDGSWVQFWRIITAPAGATKLRINPGMRHRGASILVAAGWDFDVDSVSIVKSSVLMPYWDGDTPDTSSYVYDWTGTVGNSPATRTSVGAVDYDEPDESFLRIDAGALGGKIERSELDVSTLQLQLFDASLSPAAADSVVAPGRGIRVWAFDDAAMTWRRKFTGEIGPCVVEYDPIEDERYGAPNITLSAVGSESILAQSSRPGVTRTPAHLTTLALAGAGVPWDVDGNTGTAAGAEDIATVEDATALDQVALTRDTVGGFAWVNSEGAVIFRSVLEGGEPGPPPAAADTFERVETDGWGTADTGGAWTIATGTADTFSVSEGRGFHAVGPGATDESQLGVSATDVDATVSVAVSRLPDAGLVWSFLGARVSGSDHYAARVRVNPDGTVGLHLVRSETPVVGANVVPGLSVAPGDRLMVRLEVTGTMPTSIRAKVWPVGSEEPTEWTYETSDSTPANQLPGGVMLRSFGSSQMTDPTPVEVGYDDLLAIDLNASDPNAMGPEDYMGEGLSVSFSTERLINSVTIKRVIRASDGSTEERTHGPYEDLDSIRRWGRRSQTVTIASVPDDTAQADTAAAAILAANATPQIIVESLQVNAGDDRTHAFHELYDLVTVDVDTIDGAVSQASRIVTIVDEFAAEREGGRSGTWYTGYGFMADGGVAAPSIQPPPSSASELGAWTELPGSTGAGVSITTKEYRVTGAGVQIRLAGTLTGALTVPITGNIGDISIGVLPEGARPSGSGIAATAPFPIDIGGVIAHCYIYNGGSISIANVESRGVEYTLGSNGTGVSGISPIFSINS